MILDLVLASLPYAVLWWIALAALLFAWRTHVKLSAEIRRCEDRVAVLYDRLNDREGRVRVIPITQEQRESPLPAMKVVKR